MPKGMCYFLTVSNKIPLKLVCLAKRLDRLKVILNIKLHFSEILVQVKIHPQYIPGGLSRFTIIIYNSSFLV